MIVQETRFNELYDVLEFDISNNVKDYAFLQSLFTAYFYPLWHRACVHINAACCLQIPVPQRPTRVSGRRQLVPLTAPHVAAAFHCLVLRVLMCRKVFYALATRVFRTRWGSMRWSQI